MNYYLFKTFTTNYYFPEIIDQQKDKQFLYKLYSPFGSYISKSYWWMFRHCKLVRRISRVHFYEIPIPMELIKKESNRRCIMAFNMGSPGIEQKVSILGYDYDKNQPFFAKYSEKKEAIKISRNEINVLNELKDNELAPELYKSSVATTYVYFETEFITGKRPKNMLFTKEIVQLCLELRKLKLKDTEDESLKTLEYSLSHGDFCPWNMLMDNHKIKLIDWELAKNRPLGYDLFTYLCQVTILFEPQKELYEILKDHEELIKYYFDVCGVDNYVPYALWFAREKSVYEKKKGHFKHAQKYDLLKEKLKGLI